MNPSVPRVAARRLTPRPMSAAPIIGLVLVLVTALAPAAAADSATIEQGTDTTSIVDTFDCQGWPEGSLVGTDVVEYRAVSKGDALHVTGVDRATFRADGPNGMYAIGGSLDRFTFEVGLGGVYNNTHHDWATVYDASGQRLWEADYRLIERFTITPDGTLRVELARVVFDNFPCGG